jgi:AcrR family transcriptional regulator
MDEARTLTAKGSRQADAVLDATIQCLGEQGYGGTSLQRIAAAAGVQKRMVLYYFGSREQLMAAALERVAERFLTELEGRVAEAASPAEVVDAVFAAVWSQLDDRLLLGAYFGLVAESATDPVLRAKLDELRGRAHELADAVLDELDAAGHRLSMERELLILAAGVAAHGIGMDVLEHGKTPALERAASLARAGAPLMLFD